MARNSIIRAVITGDSSGLDRALGRSESRLGSFGRTAGRVLAGFGGLAAGAAVLSKPLVDAAVDLNEEMSKSSVVFGDAAASVQHFADTAAVSLGISETEALRAAGNFGQFGIAAELSGDELAKFSTDLTAAAADLASFNNLDPGEALQKLQSGLAGSSEPLRSAGIFLTEAAVAARAAEMGLGDVNGELTEGEKVLARYDLILGQMGEQGSMGDFARTSDSLANKQRILSARFSDVQAELGQRLLPVALAAADGLLTLLDGFESLAAVFQEEGFSGVLAVIRGKVAEWGAAFVEWVPGAFRELITESNDWFWNRFVPWIEEQTQPLEDELGRWGTAFADWADDIDMESLKRLGSRIWEWMRTDLYDTWKTGWDELYGPDSWVRQTVWPKLEEGFNWLKTKVTTFWTETVEPWISNQLAFSGGRIGDAFLGGLGAAVTSFSPSDLVPDLPSFDLPGIGALGGMLGGSSSQSGVTPAPKKSKIVIEMNSREVAEAVFEEDRLSGGALSGAR